MTEAEIERGIITIVAQILELPEADVVTARAASMKEALGMNSMRAIEIIAEAERTFSVEIDEEKLTEIHTLDDTIAVVKAALAARAGRSAAASTVRA